MCKLLTSSKLCAPAKAAIIIFCEWWCQTPGQSSSDVVKLKIKPSQRGAANGLSVSLVSLFKAIGPGAGGAIFAWAQRRHSKFLPGNQMVFFMLGLVALAAAICTAELFLPKSLDKTMHEEEDE